MSFTFGSLSSPLDEIIAEAKVSHVSGPVTLENYVSDLENEHDALERRIGKLGVQIKELEHKIDKDDDDLRPLLLLTSMIRQLEGLKTYSLVLNNIEHYCS